MNLIWDMLYCITLNTAYCNHAMKPVSVMQPWNLAFRGIRNKSILIDGLWSEVQGSINSAYYDNEISGEQAEYLRKKYLGLGVQVNRTGFHQLLIRPGSFSALFCLIRFI